MEQRGLVRIGELSKRTGVSPELLRAWERRYGVLRPTRSEGGFRLYSVDDERRVRTMLRQLAAGLSAAEAARLATEAPDGESVFDASARSALTDRAGELAGALESFDEARAQSLLDGLFASLTVETVLRDVVIPYLHDLGERWEAGEITVEQEHFSSNVIRARLLSIARGWEGGRGPLALLACLPSELHELGLLCFGIALRNQGWRIAYLGADTPLDSVRGAAARLTPDVVVLVGSVASLFVSESEAIREVARSAPVLVAGPGADEAFAASVDARMLTGDPITAAREVAAVGRRRRS